MYILQNTLYKRQNVISNLTLVPIELNQLGFTATCNNYTMIIILGCTMVEECINAWEQ